MRAHTKSMPSPRSTRRRRQNKSRRHRGGGLSDVLPTTTWGNWANYPGALAWSAGTTAPAPLANGGLYTGPQSTGAWASSPFPATQYGESVESARLAQNPEVFFQQPPVANMGNNFSPYVAQPLSSQHYSAQMPPNVAAMAGGSRRNRKLSRRRKEKRRSK